MAIEAPAQTPLMQQYAQLKNKHPQELLLFRLGDFFELFADDAKRAAPLLEVALTQRQGIPMCGVPAHAADAYIAKLLRAGLRVAVADQMEQPQTGKGLVRRDVVRVITPGTLHEDTLLSAKQNNFLAAIYPDKSHIGLATIECSTGEFLATEVPALENSSALWDELTRLKPSEVVVPAGPETEKLRVTLVHKGFSIAELPALDFAARMAEERLKTAFQAASLRGFGLEDKPRALAAAGAVLRYLENTQCGRPFSTKLLHTYAIGDTLQMDAATLDHLDLLPQAGAAPGKSLLEVMDETLTPMGGRLLRRWIVAPLRNVKAIEERLDRVQFFVEGKDVRRRVRTLLQGWPDFERILARLAAGTTAPRDLAHLGRGLQLMPQLISTLQPSSPSDSVGDLWQLKQFMDPPSGTAGDDGLKKLTELLDRAIVEAPPPTLKDGGVIKDGYHAELDEVRSWIHDGKTRLLELEQKEREATGISSLKVSFNNVFGYYLEVTKTHLAKVPAHYHRKQTTANGERYITPELKEYENKILGAEERALRIEADLFNHLREAILKESAMLRDMAEALANVDITQGLAEIAALQRYVRPTVDDSARLAIRDGRHPVLESVLPSGTLVPNDLELDGKDRQIVILTGPNMSGKSTYLRQNALIAILAQMGSFVPAAEAHIGALDYLFTRIGASDRLADGESTFMVEMVETARILNHATPRSLVILDEVGRGTSTYDGMAIAGACLEYLHSKGRNGQCATRDNIKATLDVTALPHPANAVMEDDPASKKTGSRGIAHCAVAPKVLFATHFFELTEMSKRFPQIHNAHVTAREWGENVVFLHKVEAGPADRAYGIHVARLAGVPKTVLERAAILLATFEKGQKNRPIDENPLQPSLFDRPNDTLLNGLRQELVDKDLNALTPLQALVWLQDWQTKLRQAKD